MRTYWCGKLQKEVITRVVDGMALPAASRVLPTGGETSEQPGKCEGTYLQPRVGVAKIR